MALPQVTCQVQAVPRAELAVCQLLALAPLKQGNVDFFINAMLLGQMLPSQGHAPAAKLAVEVLCNWKARALPTLHLQIFLPGDPVHRLQVLGDHVPCVLDL